MSINEPTILIIGAGTFGTSTAYHLAKSYTDPSRVTIVDRAPSPPKPAASVDINRIIRPDYDTPLYCNLAWEAIHGWFWGPELQEFFRQHGGVMMYDNAAKAERTRDVFKRRGYDQTEAISLDQLGAFEKGRGMLGGTSIEGFEDAYWNPDAGWVNAVRFGSSLDLMSS
jgi:sarcosine oxidase/L-pipecolate oxidase